MALDVVGLVVGAVLLFLGALVLRRRRFRGRGGSVDCSLRLHTGTAHRGWTLGVAVFTGEDLSWYRVFSLSPRPRRVLPRRGLHVVGRREPTRQERMALLPGTTVVCLTETGRDGTDREVEVAMTEAATMGFLSWLESAPPGSGRPGEGSRR